jgi:predicted phage baseplate assembly protein
MLSSERGRIKVPDLDDRTWNDLVEEAKALIPKYAPQWTDHNPSDLGITLIELFAYLVEGLIYRLNRVPEKNYIAFLNLLGITRDPPAPARAFLTFTANPSAPDIVEVPAGTQAEARGSETQSPIIFETIEPVTVLPVNLTTALLITKHTDNKFKYSNVSPSLTSPPARGLAISIPANTAALLCLGFDKPTTKELHLKIQLTRAAPAGSVAWTYSTKNQAPMSWLDVPGVPKEPADPAAAVAALRRDGSFSIVVDANLPDGEWDTQIPADWSNATPDSVQPATNDDKVELKLAWLGARISNESLSPCIVGIDYLLFNSAAAQTALTVKNELLGKSNGEPWQKLALRNRPLDRERNAANPYAHLIVTVGGEVWHPTDDFRPAEDKVYLLDPVTGEITFGSFDPEITAHTLGLGRIPPRGAPIVATTYRYVAAGANGNVQAGAINTMRERVEGITRVTNLFAAYDGTDEEPIDDTLRRAPQRIRNKDRAVTAEDYEYLAREASSDIAVVRCLGPRLKKNGEPWLFGGIDRSPGNVNVIVAFHTDIDDPRPEPTTEQIFQIQQYLDHRRDLNAKLRVLGPCYLPISVTAKVLMWNSAVESGKVTNKEALEAEIKRKIAAFLHPTQGGTRGQGWEVGQPVMLLDLFQAIMPSEDIGYITHLELTVTTPKYESASEFPLERKDRLSSVLLADFELVCSELVGGKPEDAHSVTVNPA